MTDDSVRCDELVELVTDYLDGALAPDARARFDAHLAECDGCSAYVDQFRTTVGVLGRAHVDDLDTDFRDRLLQVFTTWNP